MIVHIGRKVPKGLREVAGSIHLGRGIWAFRCEVDKEVAAKPRARKGARKGRR